MKKIILLVLALLFTFSTVGCSKTILMPDVSTLDIQTAKTLLVSKGIIPKVEYEYSDEISLDSVIKTVPEVGEKVKQDDTVVVYVSKGQKRYELKQALSIIYDVNGIKPFVSWMDASDGEGTKGHYIPYLEEGYLHLPVYICCSSNYELEFYGDFGVASVNDTFDKQVPVDLIYDSKTIKNDGSKTEFTIKVPLSDLGVQKPTNLYISADIKVGNNLNSFRADFILTW